MKAGVEVTQPISPWIFSLLSFKLPCSFFVYIKSPAKTEEGLLQHCPKNQAFPNRMTHVVFEMFWVASLFGRDMDMPPCNYHRSVCWVPSCCRPWDGHWHGGPWHAALWWVSWVSALGPAVALIYKWGYCHPDAMKKPAQIMHREKAEPGLFDPRAPSGSHQLLVTLCLRCHGQVKTRPPAVLHGPPTPSTPKSQNGEDGLPRQPSTYLTWKTSCKNK